MSEDFCYGNYGRVLEMEIEIGGRGGRMESIELVLLGVNNAPGFKGRLRNWDGRFRILGFRL